MRDSCIAPSASRLSAANISKFPEEKDSKIEQDNDHSESDDADYDRPSPSSTIYYHQEPFYVFKKRVAELCARQFNNATITISRLSSRTYNRNTAITVKPLPARTLSLA
jgi:hypothetical protein